jgi:hypothetical protein
VRVYLGLAAKGQDISLDVLNRVRTVIETAFPVPPDVIRGREWHGRGVSLFAWTNEPDDSRRPPMLSEHGERIIGLNGHLADPADVARLPDDSVGGCFSAWTARDGELTASTAINRVCPVFYAETPVAHLVGSRALLVHLVARPEVVHDVLALQTMVRQGFFEVIYTLILRLAPKLGNVPIEGKPWRFTEGMPRSLWRRRSPGHMPTSKTGGGWSWRTSPGPALTDVLREQVLGSLDALAPIVNPDEVRALFTGPVVQKPALAWHLYTVSTLLTGLYPGGRPQDLPEITVSRPDPAR